MGGAKARGGVGSGDGDGQGEKREQRRDLGDPGWTCPSPLAASAAPRARLDGSGREAGAG